MSPSIPLGLAFAMFGFAAYMQLLARRSAAGRMGSNGPGIRIAETTACEHTWAAAQEVAGPIYRKISVALGATAAITIAVASANATAAFVGAIVVGLGIEVFFLGVASVRARKAAATIDCEHSRLAKTQRAKSKRTKADDAKASDAKPSSNFSPAHRRNKRRR